MQLCHAEFNLFLVFIDSVCFNSQAEAISLWLNPCLAAKLISRSSTFRLCPQRLTNWVTGINKSVWGSYLPLCQQVPGCRLLLQPLFVGGINQDVACGLGFRQPAEEFLQVEVELLQQPQSCIQGRLPVRDPGGETRARRDACHRRNLKDKQQKWETAL